MNVELFIARKILSGSNDSANISKPIINIAKIAIALSLAVMIVSVAVVVGFKTTIRNKALGFSSHFQIINYEINSSYEMSPISKNQPFLESLKALEGVRHVQMFAMKTGIIKTKDNIQGVVIKGVGADFDWSFFREHIVEGSTFSVTKDSTSNNIIISKYLANLLKLKIGDTFVTSFLPKSNSESIRYRVFKISGMYSTNLEEFDKRYILADIAHVQKLNNWTSDQVGGYDVSIKNFDDIGRMHEVIMDEVGYGFLPDGSKLKVQSIEEANPAIFDWLGLLDMNVWVILILMVLVASMNMVSGLLVIILEKTNMIGILKAVGARNVSVRKIFLYNGAFIVGYGLFWGNLIGVAICLVQYFFRVMPLDPQTYFISYVPIDVSIVNILVLNLGTLVITMAMLILPSYIITKMSPVKAIRFE